MNGIAFIELNSRRNVRAELSSSFSSVLSPLPADDEPPEHLDVKLQLATVDDGEEDDAVDTNAEVNHF